MSLKGMTHRFNVLTIAFKNTPTTNHGFFVRQRGSAHVGRQRK